MKKVSDSAKAAAVMHFVSDSGDTALTPEMAVELFNELGQTFGPINDVLDKYEMTRFAAARQAMPDERGDLLVRNGVQESSRDGHGPASASLVAALCKGRLCFTSVGQRLIAGVATITSARRT